ncbi:MAG: hypothetical protein H0W15_09645, partial [Gemmatimonadales bacterium]|nr:hypothetical protein [Gemmatimonadales bacterium]
PALLRLATLLVVSQSFLAACGAPDPTLPSARPPGSGTLAPNLSLSANAVCPTTNSYLFRTSCWNAGQVITLKVPPNRETAAQAAIADWNQYLEQDAAAPRFAVSTSFGAVTVSETGAQSSTQWCGTFDGDSLAWVTITGAASCNFGAHKGSWRAALLQETAGILGWSESVEAVPDRFEPGMTTLCVLHLSKFSSVINDQVCVHEAEGVVLAYRNLETVVTDPANFWRDSVYMHARIVNPSGTILPGDTVLVVADTFYSGGLGGSSGMPAQMQAAGHIAIAKPTNGEVSWSSGSTGVLTHLGGGNFRAWSPGSAYVRAKPSRAPTTKTRWWLPFQERGDSILLTVAPPPPPPPSPYVVTTDEVPIWTAGNHTFTAHIGTSSSTIYWQVDDSRTTTVDPDATYTTSGQQLTISVGSGSYNLRFRVALSSAGPWDIQDIPVCTQTSQLQGAKAGGGGSIDAVANCPPPGGGQQ